ncbi:MAG: hypothetical protein Q7R35_01645 [Elusimicrobiota bacterium]|nr:hypothetical protein [Elusimicrobiota bacterium]
MKNAKLRLLFTALFLCAAGIPAFAQEKPTEEQTLEISAGELDKNHSEGQQRVAEKIIAEFGVADGLIVGLRFKKMGYGEIAIALGLSQGLHRIIQEEDLRKIVELRQGPPVMGWGRIANDLGLKLGPVISKVRKISAEVLRDEKADKAKKDKIAKKEMDKKVKTAKKLNRPGKTVKEGMKALARQ